MLGRRYLADANKRFHDLERLGDNALAQVSDADFFRVLDAESNSIAILLKHVAGNMKSRWSDLFVSDGEKSDRDRDSEFVTTADDNRAAIVDAWTNGWKLLFSVIGHLDEEQLMETVTVRGEPHLVVEAIDRQLVHYAYHVGQIVFLAKHFASERWQNLSVPRGASVKHNDEVRRRAEER